MSSPSAKNLNRVRERRYVLTNKYAMDLVSTRPITRKAMVEAKRSNVAVKAVGRAKD